MKLSLHLFISLFFLFSTSVFAQTETEKGVELYRNGDYDGAIAVLENVIKTNEKDRQAWLYKGAAYTKKGKDKEAAKAFRKWDSIKIKPNGNFVKDDSTENVKILSKPRATSMDTARQNNTEGRVKLVVEFMENEKIGIVFALQTLPDGLTENCIYAARQIKFKAAQKNGKPISVLKIIEYSFSYF